MYVCKKLKKKLNHVLILECLQILVILVLGKHLFSSLDPFLRQIYRMDRSSKGRILLLQVPIYHTKCTFIGIQNVCDVLILFSSPLIKYVFSSDKYSIK